MQIAPNCDSATAPMLLRDTAVKKMLIQIIVLCLSSILQWSPTATIGRVHPFRMCNVIVQGVSPPD